MVGPGIRPDEGEDQWGDIGVGWDTGPIDEELMDDSQDFNPVDAN